MIIHEFTAPLILASQLNVITLNVTPTVNVILTPMVVSNANVIN